MATSGDIRPVPDPTVLTTEASMRLEGMIRNLIKTEIMHLTDLMMEKIARVEDRFMALEGRTAEQKKDTQDALAAALNAQKEAAGAQTASSDRSITKSETATSEKIKALETIIATSTQAITDKIGDLKDRVIAIEATKYGARESGVDTRALVAIAISAILALAAITAIIVAVVKP